MPVTNTTVTIPAGQSLSSNSVNLSGAIAMWVRMPASTNGANLTFQASLDGTTWGDLYDGDAREMIVGFVPNAQVVLDLEVAKGAAQIKVRSGTARFPVAQAV